MDGWLTGLIATLAVAAAGLGGWPVTAGVLRLAARSNDAGRPQSSPDEDDDSVPPASTPSAPAVGTGPAVVTVPALQTGPPVSRSEARRRERAAEEVPPPPPRTPASPAPAAAAPPGPPVPDLVGGPIGPEARDALRGGTWIGILERLAIAATLVAGYPGGIAYVIAIKGLGRYPELRENPGASERFVIGTLASMLWAASLGLAARTVLLASM